MWLRASVYGILASLALGGLCFVLPPRPVFISLYVAVGAPLSMLLTAVLPSSVVYSFAREGGPQFSVPAFLLAAFVTWAVILGVLIYARMRRRR